jgi:adenylate kinase
VQEYDLHIRGVKDAFKGFIYEINSEGNKDEVLNDIAKMLKLKMRNNAPRRPPRILILGPPGSGRSSQAKTVAQAYGLVHISTTDLLKDEIARKTENGRTISRVISSGDFVPDDIIINLVEQRIKQSDCRVNGWILDGFPKTSAQINMLKTLRVVPSLVVMFECSEDTCITRLSNRKVDPQTGIYYDMSLNPPQDDNILKRLTAVDED